MSVLAYSNLPNEAHAIEVGLWGVMVVRGDVSAYHNYRIFCSVPCGVLAMPFVLPLVPWIMLASRREQRRKRLAAGRCVACGYDLRASAELCPECGAGRTVTIGGAPVRKG